MGNTTSRDGDTMRHDGLEAVTPTEAARRLGITPDAVRARLRRGTLPGELDGHEWTVYLLPKHPTVPNGTVGTQRDTDTTHRATRHDADTTSPMGDTTASTTVDSLIAAKDETIGRLGTEVAYLREQLDHSRRELSAERERFDVIHREALQRIEALTSGPIEEPATERAAVSPSDAPGREEVAQGVESREHPQSHVAGWLRRLFGRS